MFVGRALAFLFAAFVNPIAWPAWSLEWFVRLRKRDWQFSAYTATPYLGGLAFVASWLVIFEPVHLKYVGLYLATAMEIVALWICLAVALGGDGQTARLLKLYARRRAGASATFPLSSALKSLYSAIVAYFFTIYWFALMYFMLGFSCKSCFKRSAEDTGLIAFADFLYFSLVTITTYGYDGISPASFFAKFLISWEIIIGTFLTVFVFGSFVNLQGAAQKK